MPQLPKGVDWSVPRPSNWPTIQNGKYTPFPALKPTVNPLLVNTYRHYYPLPDFTSLGGSAQPGVISERQEPPANFKGPVPWINPHWPVLPPIRGNPTVMATPGILKEDM